MDIIRLFHRDQPVANARFRDQNLGAGGIGFDLLTHLTDIDTQIVSFVHVLRPPHLAQYLAMRHDLPGVLDHELQQRVFRRCELDWLIIDGHSATR